jgi:hypothetical protein
MSGRRTQMPKGTRVGDDGKLILPAQKPRDASQAKAWAKGGKRKQRVVSKAAARAMNTIGKIR